MASETPTLQLDDAPGDCQLNNSQLNLATMVFFRGKSGANRTAKACERPHGHQSSLETAMTPHAVNWRRDYYYTAMGTEGTRALIGPSEDDSIGGDGVESDSAESDNAKDDSTKDNVNDEDGSVDRVSPVDDTDRHNGWHALSGNSIQEGGN